MFLNLTLLCPPTIISIQFLCPTTRNVCSTSSLKQAFQQITEMYILRTQYLSYNNMMIINGKPRGKAL